MFCCCIADVYSYVIHQCQLDLRLWDCLLTDPLVPSPLHGQPPTPAPVRLILSCGRIQGHLSLTLLLKDLFPIIVLMGYDAV